MLYAIKYKRRGQWFWRTVKNVKGHTIVNDKLEVFFNDGIVVIPHWSELDFKLGSDFILKQKEDMEKESGQDIKINKE